jgi:hypothetical protein
MPHEHALIPTFLCGISLAPEVGMKLQAIGNVVYAAAVFRCSHPFVAALGRGGPMFTCTDCGYQTDELPLRMGRAKSIVSAIAMRPSRTALRRDSVA